MYYTADTAEQVCFTVEVRVPVALAASFADALTGDDHDIILAGEKAMRERLDALGAPESIELSPEDATLTLQAELRHAHARTGS